MRKLKYLGFVLFVVSFLVVLYGFMKKEAAFVKFDDYLGFTDNARWVYEGVRIHINFSPLPDCGAMIV
jgi:hypothetical protein